MKNTARTTANLIKSYWPDINPSHRSLVVVLILITMISIGLSVVSTQSGQSPQNSLDVLPREKILISGKVSMAEYMRGDRQRIRLSRDGSEDWLVEDYHDISLVTARNTIKITPGDLITGYVRINPPLRMLLPDSFDFTAHALNQGYGATGFIDNITVTEHVSPEVAAHLRYSIQQNLYKYLEKDKAAVASAVLVGLRGGISSEVREDFRASGLSHLLAISGLHMALFWGSVMALIRAILASYPHFSSRYPALKIATVMAFPFGLFYLVISGMPVSAVRAFLMLALFMLAIMMAKRGVTLHNVALAAIIILLINPQQLTQPAFQMSFAAVFALVAGWVALSSRQREPSLLQQKMPVILKYLGGIMVGSVLAGLATAPFVLHHFGVTTMWSIIANLIGMPLMAFIIMPFGAIGLAFMPIGWESPFLHVMGFGISCLLWIAELTSSLPLSHIATKPPSSLVLYCYAVGLILFVILKGRMKLVSVFCFITAMMFWGFQPRPMAAMTFLHHRALATISDGSQTYISRKSATDFERSVIARPFGLNDTSYIGDAPQSSQRFDLVIHENGLKIAMVWRNKPFRAACVDVDLVLVMTPRFVRPCKAITIAPHNIRKHGGVLVFQDKTGIILKYADGYNQHFRIDQ